MNIRYTVIVLCALGQIGAEAQIHLFYEDAEIILIDPEYFDPELTTYIVTDDNQVAANYSIAKQLPEQTYGHFVLWGYSMGQYVMSTGLNIERMFCDLIGEPIIYRPFFTAMGMPPESCPPGPGLYIHEGYTVPSGNLPNTFPENRYLMIFDILYLERPILSTSVYLEIQN